MLSNVEGWHDGVWLVVEASDLHACEVPSHCLNNKPQIPLGNDFCGCSSPSEDNKEVTSRMLSPPLGVDCEGSTVGALSLTQH